MNNILFHKNANTGLYDILYIDHVFFDQLDSTIRRENIPAVVIESLLSQLLMSLEQFELEGYKYAISDSENRS